MFRYHSYRLYPTASQARLMDAAVETCRRYGIHAQTARQVQLTFDQISTVARQLKKRKETPNEVESPAPADEENPLSSFRGRFYECLQIICYSVK